MRVPVLLAIVLASAPAAAQEPVSIEAIAAAYFGADTYCDAGKQAWRYDPATPYVQETLFERCVRRDGRFKYVERDARAGATAKWSDAKRFYHYSEFSRRYQDLSLDDPFTFDHYRNRGQVFPVFVFEAISSDPRRISDPGERKKYFESYALSSALSTPQYSVFERSLGGSHGESERLWVRTADRSIARHERIGKGGVLRYAEITARELNRPLADADLDYQVPLLARYSFMNNPKVFIAALIVASGLAGLVFWGVLFARCDVPEDVLPKRRFLWRLHLWVYGVVAILLALLAAITSGGGGGHPPAIVIVYILGYWSAVALGVSASFTLASYPLQLLFRSRVS